MKHLLLGSAAALTEVPRAPVRKTSVQIAIEALAERGRRVEPSGLIPGLYRIDGGPEITTNQLIHISMTLPPR